MKKTILILLCGWFAIMATRAQCAAQNEAIQAGEELVYDLKFNWKFIWVAAGQAKMDMQAITYQGKPCFRSNLISVSNKQVDFFFKMRDTLTCITSSRLEPVYFRKGAEEGDRYTVDEVWFSYKNGKCIADQRRMRREMEGKGLENSSKNLVVTPQDAEADTIISAELEKYVAGDQSMDDAIANMQKNLEAKIGKATIE